MALLHMNLFCLLATKHPHASQENSGQKGLQNSLKDWP